MVRYLSLSTVSGKSVYGACGSDTLKKKGGAMRVLSLGVLLCMGLLVGCAAPYNTNFPLVEKNMSVQQVSELLGKPVSAESGPGETKLFYYRLASSILDTDGSDTRDYWVQVQDGVVIGYGERRDATTLQRQAQQFESTWRGVQSINEMNKALIQANPVSNTAVKPAPKTTNCQMLGTSMQCISY